MDDDVVTPDPTLEAPVADQPEAPEPVAPEAAAPGTSDTAPATPEADAPESDDESFTDIDPETLPEEAKEPYKRLQADYTRKTQALAERHAELDQAVSFVSDLVSDEANDTQEQVFRVLAERLGYEIDGDDAEIPDDEPADETPEFRDPRLDPILAEREEKAEADRQKAYDEELDAHEATITSGITALAKKDGLELTEEEADVVFSNVLALPALNGGPDIKGAYDRYRAATQADWDRRVKSKGSTLTPGGEVAQEPVDLKNEESRQQHMANIIEATRRAQSGL